MKTCFLFGQHDAPIRIQERLCSELDSLIRFNGVTDLLVGHRGSFDQMAISSVQTLLRRMPQIYARLLIAYRNTPNTLELPDFFSDFYYPIELNQVPPRHAIVKANEIALLESDYIITFCNREGGNTGRLLRKAKRLEGNGHLNIINLASDGQQEPIYQSSLNR